MRQNRAQRERKKAPEGSPPGPEKEEQTGTGNSSGGHEAQEPQYEWVMIEHRDADGNPTFPRHLLESTYQRRYAEVPPGTELEAHVLAGYKPKPLMMVERKIYEIQSLSLRGWRRSGLIGVEVDEWRAHEADWFNAMQGVKLRISNPGRPGPNNEETEYRVSDTSFDRKVVTVIDQAGSTIEHRLHEGTLNITETWKSAWRRQGVAVLNLGFKLLLAPLLVGLGVGGTLLWIQRRTGPDADARHSQPTKSAQSDQAEEGTSNNPTAMDTDAPRDVPEAAGGQATPTGGSASSQGAGHDSQEDRPIEEGGPEP